MKCENENCDNEVREEDINRGCAGYWDHDDCTRHCSCCLDCRDKCIDGAIEEDEEGYQTTARSEGQPGF